MSAKAVRPTDAAGTPARHHVVVIGSGFGGLTAARELAKTYAPTIGVCQADGSAEGQKWLSMANVSNAKTSKQAEADWILGLGKTHEETAEYIRYINLSKNKLMGDKDTIHSLRHGRFEVVIQPEIARYKDIVKYE